MTHADRWGDDQRASLKMALKDAEEQIKTLKKEARLAPNLPERIEIEKKSRTLEIKRDEAWKRYEQAAKEIDEKKDSLLDEVEKRLKQSTQESSLFTIR